MRQVGSSLKSARQVCTAIIVGLSINNFVIAQQPPQRAQPTGSQAIQLPLSGRSAQAGSVNATQTPVPGTTSSVNTTNPTVQIQGVYSGSAPSTRLPFSGRLSLRDAVQRAIEYNLGRVGFDQTAEQSRGLRRSIRSALLPNLSINISEMVEQLNLQASGLQFNVPVPGILLPRVVGPFNVFDVRANLSQTLFDLTALNNYRASGESVRANELSAEDARDLVVLAAGGVYLQVISAKAKIESAQAQLETANALLRQTSQQRAAGVVAQVDLNRSQVEVMTQQQRLVTLQSDLAKQKIILARLTGLPPNQMYEISDSVPYSDPPAITLEIALRQALEERSDLKAAEAQVRAAERTRSAARAERLPSVSVSADYGAIGTNPAQSHGTFTVVGVVHIPIWQGGRTEGNIAQAEAALIQRRAELEDIKGRIESDVRNAFLDLQAATSQVDVALKNIDVTKQNLDLTRQRFEAGVSDNVEVIQSQESLTTAQLDYINSVFAHNLAKLSLARAIGRAADRLPQFLNLK